ncbi:MAG: hypothetical protein Q8920_11180 [Bacillota bacterium]|nr:hypothetical protein [Bacillota bacterium]
MAVKQNKKVSLKWSIKAVLAIITIILLLPGCSSKPAVAEVSTQSGNVHQNSKTPDKTSNDTANNNYDLTTLDIKLPIGWLLDTLDKRQYNFVDEKGKNKGWIMSNKYEENFDFSNVQPNHSSIISNETIDIPLGKCSLFTLDSDNDTAASGVTGTHNDYYAIISVKDKVIYIIEFSNSDKSPETKVQFIKILRDLSLK